MPARTRSRSVERVKDDGAVVGRERELAELATTFAGAARGDGALVFLAGEAGVGKTTLAEQAARRSGLQTLAVATPRTCLPYGPLVSALRAFTRAHPDGLADCGPLTPFLAVLLPELGTAPESADAATLQEALTAAVMTVAAYEPSVFVLDDVHWADHSTLETLEVVAGAIADQPCVVVATYRSDEVPRDHPLRRLRRDLRRARRLRELVLEPLDEPACAALAARMLGKRPSKELRTMLYARTAGLPFYVEELSAALQETGAIRGSRAGATLADSADWPVPDSVREAVAMRLAGRSDACREALEVAAVAGITVDVELVGDLASEPGLDEAFRHGILRENEPRLASFRHALTRDAVYADVPWTRRRRLHRLLAERLELREASSLAAAEHWLLAREFHRACPALAEAARQFAAVHAYRDALAAGRRASEVWPDGADEEGRIALTAEIARCAQLAGELSEAAAAWRELADRRRLAGDPAGVAQATRELATTYELQGAAELALATRRESAASFARAELPGEAAAELVAAAAHLDSAGSIGAALQVVERALEEARRAGRRDLEARALGIEGTARAKLGELDAGLVVARAALDLALDEDLTDTAGDAYQRLANVLENAGDYRAAWDAYQAGYEFCEAHDEPVAAQVCLICLGAILVFTGEWDRALKLDNDILNDPNAPLGARMGAKQQIGLVGAARGDRRRSRALLAESGAYAERFERQRMEVWDAMGQGWLDELENATEAGLDRCRLLLARWGSSESLHYPIPALRWATTFCATHDAEPEARECAAAVARLAGSTANPEATAAFAHALGETALLDGEPVQAAARFALSLETLRDLSLPYETAQTSLRAGVALASAGEREEAIRRLTDAYRIARKLGARPLANRAAEELVSLGEAVERRLGRRAAARLEGPGLTRRELEVMRLVASGQTNREIARSLFLSTRTVDMHMRNILYKLDCRSRAEATRRAGELGLLA
jgi:DNA-binding CsgD family transcriptional regulator